MKPDASIVGLRVCFDFESYRESEDRCDENRSRRTHVVELLADDETYLQAIETARNSRHKSKQTLSTNRGDPRAGVGRTGTEKNREVPE